MAMKKVMYTPLDYDVLGSTSSSGASSSASSSGASSSSRAMTGQITVEKFGGDKLKYRQWKLQTATACILRWGPGVARIFENKTGVSDEDDISVFCFLINVVTGLPLRLVQRVASKRATEALAILDRHFLTVDAAHGPSLIKRLLDMRFDPADVLTWSLDLQDLLQDMHTLTLDLSNPIARVMVLNQIAGLPDWNVFYEKQFPLTEPVDELIQHIVLQHEVIKTLQAGAAQQPVAVAAAAATPGRPKHDGKRDDSKKPGKQRQDGKPGKPRRHCTVCNVTGHDKATCYKEHPELRPTNKKDKGDKGNAPRPGQLALAPARANVAVDSLSSDDTCHVVAFPAVVSSFNLIDLDECVVSTQPVNSSSSVNLNDHDVRAFTTVDALPTMLSVESSFTEVYEVVFDTSPSSTREVNGCFSLIFNGDPLVDSDDDPPGLVVSDDDGESDDDLPGRAQGSTNSDDESVPPVPDAEQSAAESTGDSQAVPVSPTLSGSAVLPPHAAALSSSYEAELQAERVAELHAAEARAMVLRILPDTRTATEVQEGLPRLQQYMMADGPVHAGAVSTTEAGYLAEPLASRSVAHTSERSFEPRPGVTSRERSFALRSFTDASYAPMPPASHRAAVSAGTMAYLANTARPDVLHVSAAMAASMSAPTNGVSPPNDIDHARVPLDVLIDSVPTSANGPSLPNDIHHVLVPLLADQLFLTKAVPVLDEVAHLSTLMATAALQPVVTLSDFSDQLQDILARPLSPTIIDQLLTANISPVTTVLGEPVYPVRMLPMVARISLPSFCNRAMGVDTSQPSGRIEPPRPPHSDASRDMSGPRVKRTARMHCPAFPNDVLVRPLTPRPHYMSTAFEEASIFHPLNTAEEGDFNMVSWQFLHVFLPPVRRSEYDVLLETGFPLVKLELMWTRGAPLSVAADFYVVNPEVLQGHDVSLDDETMVAFQRTLNPDLLRVDHSATPRHDWHTGTTPPPSSPTPPPAPSPSPPTEPSSGDPLLDELNLSPAVLAYRAFDAQLRRRNRDQRRLNRDQLPVVEFSSPPVDPSELQCLFVDPGVIAAVAIDPSLMNQCVLDSGASKHLSGCLKAFTNLRMFDATSGSTPEVTVAVGAPFAATGVGTLNILTMGCLPGTTTLVPVKLVYPNALYVVGLHLTLVSVPCITHADRDGARPTGHVVTMGGPSSTLTTNNSTVIPLQLNRTINLFVFPEVSLTESSVALAAVSMEVYLRTHVALGHANAAAVAAFLKVPEKQFECNICLAVNPVRAPVLQRIPTVVDQAKAPGDVTALDLSGPYTESSGGAKYMLLARDLFSKFLFLLLLRSRVNLHLALVKLFELMSAVGVPIRRGALFQSDNEFSTTEISALMAEHGLQQSFSPPGTPELNADIERAFLTINNRVRPLLFEGQLPIVFWGYAAHHAVLLLNYTPTSRAPHSIPVEVHTSRAITDMRRKTVCTFPVYGAQAFVYNAAVENRFSPRARVGRFVGFNDVNNSYKILMTDTSRIVETPHVRFSTSVLGSTTPFQLESLVQFSLDPTLLVPHSASTGPAGPLTLSPAGPVGSAVGGALSAPEPSSTPLVPPTVVPTPPVPPTVVPPTSVSSSTAVDVEEDPLCLNVTSTHPAAIYFFGNSTYTYLEECCFLGLIEATSPPISLARALEGPDGLLWAAARDKQVDSIFRFGGWKTVKLKDVPRGVKLVRSHAVCALKYNAGDGSIKERKVRIVVDGNTQFDRGTVHDHGRFFSPVVCLDTGKTFCAYVAINHLQVGLCDISAAFVQGDPLAVKDQIYLRPAKGMAPLDEDGDEYCLLALKGLYGMKQAPLWFWKCMLRLLVDILRFIQCPADPCFFARAVNTPQQVFVVITVDDLFYAALQDDIMQGFVSALEGRFELSVKGQVSQWLNMNIQYDRARGCLELNQEAYVRRVLAQLKLDDVTPRMIPMSPTVNLVAGIDTDPVLPGHELDFYAKVLGVTTYLANATRPDIAYAVNVLARFRTKATRVHMDAMLYLVGYLKSSASLGLRYSDDDGGKCILRAFTDASYAGDALDRRSRSGGLVTLAGAAILAYSVAQKCISLSSTEAEYYALAQICKAVIFLRQVLEHFGVDMKDPVDVCIDSQPAIYLASNGDSNRNSKHVDVKAHFARECVAKMLIRLCFLRTADMAADMLTKALSRAPYRKHRVVLLGCDLKPVVTFAPEPSSRVLSARKPVTSARAGSSDAARKS